jgi:hypothetical protein
MDTYGWEKIYCAVSIMMTDASIEDRLSSVGHSLVLVTRDSDQLPDVAKPIYDEVMNLHQVWLDTQDLKQFNLELFEEKLLTLYEHVVVHTKSNSF